MNALSLFSGAGIGDLGLRASGFNFIGFSELEGDRLELIQHNFSNSKFFVGDIWETHKTIIKEFKNKDIKLIITGKDLPSSDGGYNVTPPGNYGDGKGGIVTVPPPGTTPPSGDKSFVGKDPMDDPRVKEFMKKFMGNDFLSGKQKQDMLDQFLRSIGLK